MAIKKQFKEMSLGAIYGALAPFAKSPEVEQRLNDVLNLNIVTLGQGGGRKGAELARFGFDLWMINSASVDMAEHDWIPETRKVFLKDPERGKLEGTAKNARIGHEIAQKNVQRFKAVAVDTQDADMVVVTVALGGGQGNGSIPTALEWISKVRELAEKKTEKGNPTIMVIASIPSRDEANPDIWKNAISGLKALDNFVAEKKIGSVLLVDNELIRNYYTEQRPLEFHGKVFSALDYSNIILARTIFEILTIPLLGGQVSMDSAELLEILTTPGWLTINRRDIESSEGDINIQHEIESLFKSSEVFATMDVRKTIASGIALVTNKAKAIHPGIIDAVKPTTNRALNEPSILHSAVIQSNYSGNTSYLLGLAVTASLPEQILDALIEKYEAETKRREEKEAARSISNSRLSGFDDVFSQTRSETAAAGKRKISLEDLDLIDNAPKEKKKVTLDDL